MIFPLKKLIKNPELVISFLAKKFKRIRNFNWREFFISIKSINDFHSLEIDKPTVIIVEPNEYHAEILPGFWKYFNALNYQVIIILRKVNYDSKIFSRISNTDLPQLLVMNPVFMKLALKSKKISEIGYCLISSNIYGEHYGYWGVFFDFLNFIPKTKSGTFVIEHDLSFLYSIQSKFIQKNLVLTLTPFVYENQSFPMLNPHYFGNIKITSLNKCKVFITVGSVNKRNRNFEPLINATKKLLSEGISEFKIYVIGQIEDESLKHYLPEQFIFLGSVDFQELFLKMEEADFFLPLLDPKNIGNERYLTKTTSGSKQLILGFSKIPIIHKTFAIKYGFTAENSIIQETDDLYYSFKKALAMDKEGYAKLQQNLMKLKNEIFLESLKNLRDLIIYSYKKINY